MDWESCRHAPSKLKLVCMSCTFLASAPKHTAGAVPTPWPRTHPKVEDAGKGISKQIAFNGLAHQRIMIH